jgi:uncharacterized iron-regulated membrane protein
MKRLRKTIFWCHLLVGTTAGIIILLMAVTGVLLTYERQITNWADTRGYNVVAPSSDAQRLTPETLLAKVREARPDAEPATITAQSDATLPAAIGLSNGRTVFVNPFTGDVFGEGSKRTHDFFRSLTDWHRWLGASGESRATARAITGACNLGFLFIVVSGFYLWWPRKWQWSQIRGVVWFKRKLPGKARDFNWHNVIGSWCVLPLFIVVLSGVVMSYAWANNLVYRIYGETPPAPRAPSPPAVGGERRAGEQRAERAPTEAAPQVSLAGLNGLWARAEQQVTDWQSISLRLPASTEAPVVFTIDQGNGGQPQKRAQLTLDRQSGEVVRWEPFSSNTAGRKMRSWLRFAHTGEAAGLLGQTIAGIASAGAVMLVYTGLALAWRRFRGWQARRSRKPALAASDLATVRAETGATAQSDL